MGRRSTLNISLTPELRRFVQSRVSSGRYESASEVVREGLRLLSEREYRPIETIEELKREVAIGLEQARRGRLTDGEAVFDRLEGELRKQIASRARRRRAG